MKVEITLEDGPMSLFAQHLAEQDPLCGGKISEYIFLAILEKANIHPDWRECPECCLNVWPTCLVSQAKHGSNSHNGYTTTTIPNETCPACGAKTVRLAEALEIQGCTADAYCKRLLDLAAIERKYAKGRPVP